MSEKYFQLFKNTICTRQQQPQHLVDDDERSLCMEFLFHSTNNPLEESIFNNFISFLPHAVVVIFFGWARTNESSKAAWGSAN